MADFVVEEPFRMIAYPAAGPLDQPYVILFFTYLAKNIRLRDVRSATIGSEGSASYYGVP